MSASPAVIHGPHDFLRDLMAVAESRGWWIVASELESPGYVVLHSLGQLQVDVRIAGPQGMGVRTVIAALPDMRPESADPGGRCSIYDGPGRKALQCSRDAGHSGAHINRAEAGPGMIGWDSSAGESR
jgi:hypothetical protein